VGLPLLLKAIEAQRHGEAEIGIGRRNRFDEKSRWLVRETLDEKKGDW
jgi:hypothetical protein